MHLQSKNETITAIDGLMVGHATNVAARTGCTVILCESGAVAGVDVCGSAPGTRETDAIRPSGLVSEAHAILLAGGVMQFLEARGVGFPAGPAHVPIVPGAVILIWGSGMRRCVQIERRAIKPASTLRVIRLKWGKSGPRRAQLLEKLRD